MRTDRTAFRMAVLAAVIIVAVACAADGDPTTTPESATSSSPAATPTSATSPASTVARPPVATTPLPAAPAASEAALSADTVALVDPRPAPPLVDLVNADGSTFDLAEFAGHPTLVFFGYSHCPDVCPATIGELFGVFKVAPETQAVFVSVDPERDTPEFLARWTEYMPENFHAVTGNPGAIRRAADGYGVKYARVETTSTAGYTMSHTADLYLIDETGQLVIAYPFGTPAADIVADISMLQAG